MENRNLAKLAIRKGLLKEYNNSGERIVYMEDGDEFQIQLFNPYTYTIGAEIEINGNRYKLFYAKKFEKKSELNELINNIKKLKEVKVKEIITEQNTKTPPVGLNTATLLKIASSFLKMSPHDTMVIAESLYTKGYITYPRT